MSLHGVTSQKPAMLSLHCLHQCPYRASHPRRRHSSYSTVCTNVLTGRHIPEDGIPLIALSAQCPYTASHLRRRHWSHSTVCSNVLRFLAHTHNVFPKFMKVDSRFKISRTKFQAGIHFTATSCSSLKYLKKTLKFKYKFIL
jgi:hypothetical protein